MRARSAFGKVDIAALPSPGRITERGGAARSSSRQVLYELLHRQCRGGGAAIWPAAERPRLLVDGDRSRACSRIAWQSGLRSEPYPDRRRQSFHCISQQIPGIHDHGEITVAALQLAFTDDHKRSNIRRRRRAGPREAARTRARRSSCRPSCSKGPISARSRMRSCSLHGSASGSTRASFGPAPYAGPRQRIERSGSRLQLLQNWTWPALLGINTLAMIPDDDAVVNCRRHIARRTSPMAPAMRRNSISARAIPASRSGRPRDDGRRRHLLGPMVSGSCAGHDDDGRVKCYSYPDRNRD